MSCKILQLMTRYNAWANNLIVEQLSGGGEEERSRKMTTLSGIVFESISSTLSHMFLAQELWRVRIAPEHKVVILDLNGDVMVTVDHVIAMKCWSTFSENPLVFFETFNNDVDVLLANLKRSDANFIEWLAAVDDDWLAQSFSYTDTKGVTRDRNRGVILTHVMNHQTHHRGQISAAMTIQGCSAPEMDLLYYLPEEDA